MPNTDQARTATTEDISELHRKIENGFKSANEEIGRIAGEMSASNVRVELMLKTMFGNGQRGLVDRVTRNEEKAEDVEKLSARLTTAEGKLDTAESKLDKAHGGIKTFMTMLGAAASGAGIVTAIMKLI